jgi:hypothetical protein
MVLKIPSRTQALEILEEARVNNPGNWVEHSLNSGKAAAVIAHYHPELNEEAAFVLGCLHDIGRRFGVFQMRHVIEGYRFMHVLGYDDVARICLTHSFPILNVEAVSGKWDCSPEDVQFVASFLERIELNDYDRLIQLSDALATSKGFTLIELRFVDVALRYGFNSYTIQRWQAYRQLLQYFDHAIERPVYSVLAGVVENSFGFDPCSDQGDA